MVRAFEAVAEAGSMRKAADNIHVSHTVISRHIRNLEGWMGTKLVTAGPRGVVLTAEGRVLHAAVSKSFRLIADACQALMPLSRRGALRVWCMPGLATRWLSPRLQEIEQVVPGVEIVLRSVDQVPNMADAETDLMIAFGNPDEMPETATIIVRPRMFPVVSPKWLAANSRPKTLDELSKCPLIHEDSRKQWIDWFEASGLTSGRPLRGPRLWDAGLGFDAALAGQGIALATRLTTSKEIAEGRLEELLDTDIRLGAYFLLVRRDRVADPAIGRFREWLIANISLTEAG
jgi:LysR family glycine cleavage system transcriptional activator